MKLLDVDPERLVVRVLGERIPLTCIKLRVLLVLWENRNLIVTRERLLERAWGHATGANPKVVDVQVCRLRKCLKQAGELVETAHLFGYSLNLRRASEVAAQASDRLRRTVTASGSGDGR